MFNIRLIHLVEWSKVVWCLFQFCALEFNLKRSFLIKHVSQPYDYVAPVIHKCSFCTGTFNFLLWVMLIHLFWEWLVVFTNLILWIRNRSWCYGHGLALKLSHFIQNTLSRRTQTVSDLEEQLPRNCQIMKEGWDVLAWSRK